MFLKCNLFFGKRPSCSCLMIFCHLIGHIKIYNVGPKPIRLTSCSFPLPSSHIFPLIVFSCPLSLSPFLLNVHGVPKVLHCPRVQIDCVWVCFRDKWTPRSCLRVPSGKHQHSRRNIGEIIEDNKTYVTTTSNK